MPLVVYPAALPAPSVPWESLLRPRAARSSLPGNPQARRRWRDQIEDVVTASWVYSAAEMAIWREWWSTTLIDGQLWFAAVAPGLGGFVDRVMRYRPASVRVQPFGGGGCKVSAQLEMRGRSAPPSTGVGLIDLFWARFENGTNRDEVGNWIYDLEDDPNYVREVGSGAPGSTAGSIANFDRRRFYIQNADNDNPEGGGSPLLPSSSFLNSRDWLYAVSVQPGELSTQPMDLGGFNPVSGPGQALFGLRLGFDTEVGYWIEARIDDIEGGWYLYVEGLTIDEGQWPRIGLRKTGHTFDLLVDGVVVASDAVSFSGSFAERELVSFAINRSENGNRQGLIDEPRFSYSGSASAIVSIEGDTVASGTATMTLTRTGSTSAPAQVSWAITVPSPAYVDGYGCYLDGAVGVTSGVVEFEAGETVRNLVLAFDMGGGFFSPISFVVTLSDPVGAVLGNAEADATWE